MEYRVQMIQKSKSCLIFIKNKVEEREHYYYALFQQPNLGWCLLVKPNQRVKMKWQLTDYQTKETQRERVPLPNLEHRRGIREQKNRRYKLKDMEGKKTNRRR